MRYSPYPKYKPSGIEWLGDVPEHWEVKRARFVTRLNPPSERAKKLKGIDEVSFIPMEAVGEYGGLSLDQTRPLSEIGSGYTEFDDGDIVVAKITPCFENGKGSLASGLKNGVAYGTTELHVYRTQTLLDKRFLFYLSISHPFRNLGEAEMYGAGGQKRVPPEYCKDFPIAFSADEQHTIADFLDMQTAKIDALIEKRRQLIDKLKEKRTALISRTVTRGLPPEAAKAAGLNPHPKLKHSGVEWLGEIPEHWDTITVRRVAERIETGSTPPTFEEKYYEDGTVPWFGPSSFDHEATLSNPVKFLHPSAFTDGVARMFKKHATLTVTIGATLGKVSSLPENGSCNQQITVVEFHPKKIGARYGTYQLKRLEQALRGIAPSATLPILSQDDIADIPVCKPPLPEQKSIAEYLDAETAKLDQMVDKVEAAIEKLQEYRSALITAAVTGKIDVRG